jgi:ribosomal-protein-alanine N-acetyltransferase
LGSSDGFEAPADGFEPPTAGFEASADGFKPSVARLEGLGGGLRALARAQFVPCGGLCSTVIPCVTAIDSPSLTTRIVTDRLVLRPPRPSDVPELRRLMRANADHLRPWESAPTPGEDPTSLTAIANRVTRQRRDWKRGDAYGLLLTLREKGEPIVGRINLGGVLRGAFQNAYVGYWIDREHQSRGLTSEGLIGAFAFAFGVAKLHRLQIAIMPRNAPSLRVMEKVGVRREGIAERYLRIAGKWEDHAIYGVTGEEWERMRRERALEG